MAAAWLQVPLQFTGEEMYGRYLDLHNFYHQYINLLRKHAPAKVATAQPRAEAADGDAATEDGAEAAADGAAPAEARSNGAAAQAPPLEYITYVQQFTHFHRVPRTVKFSKGYREYLQALLRYVITFHERTQPLKPVLKLLSNVEDGFEERWQEGEILGWEDRGESTLAPDADLVLDPDAFDSPQELLALGAPLLLFAVAWACLLRGQQREQQGKR